MPQKARKKNRTWKQTIPQKQNAPIFDRFNGTLNQWQKAIGPIDDQGKMEVPFIHLTIELVGFV